MAGSDELLGTGCWDALDTHNRPITSESSCHRSRRSRRMVLVDRDQSDTLMHVTTLREDYNNINPWMV